MLEANYARPTALVQDATRAGCAVIDGRLWLLHQAIPAFEHFTGRPAPVEAMRKALWKKDLGRRTGILHSSVSVGRESRPSPGR